MLNNYGLNEFSKERLRVEYKVDISIARTGETRETTCSAIYRYARRALRCNSECTLLDFFSILVDLAFRIFFLPIFFAYVIVDIVYR